MKLKKIKVTKAFTVRIFCNRWAGRGDAVKILVAEEHVNSMGDVMEVISQYPARSGYVITRRIVGYDAFPDESQLKRIFNVDK